MSNAGSRHVLEDFDFLDEGPDSENETRRSSFKMMELFNQTATVSMNKEMAEELVDLINRCGHVSDAVHALKRGLENSFRLPKKTI